MTEGEILKPVDYSKNLKTRTDARYSEKAEEHKVFLGELEAAEVSWKEATKSVLEAVRAGNDLMAADVNAMKAAVGHVGKEPCVTGSDRVFTIAGKVADAGGGTVGIPGLLVKVLGPGQTEKQALAEAVTDSCGNFALRLDKEALGSVHGRKTELTFVVYSDAREVIHSEDVAMEVRVGRIERVHLAVCCPEEIRNRLAAGEALRASVEVDNEKVEKAAGDMMAADTDLKSIMEMELEDLRLLRNEMAVESVEDETEASR
jgi:hypothetical protein